MVSVEKHIAGSHHTLDIECNYAMFRATSHLQKVDYGIPQGSCLGPLLLYTLMIMNVVLQGSISLQGDIDINMTSAMEWMRQYRLTSNAAISEFMHISHSRQQSTRHELKEI